MTWYEADDTPQVTEFGPVTGLAVTGRGAPGGPEYGEAVGALYAVAGPLLGLAAAAGHGFPMPPMEGRWWVEDDGPPLEVPRERWHWHLFLRLPDGLDPFLAAQAGEAAVGACPQARRVQLVTFAEGRCVQMMHRGPFEDEPKSLALMDELMRREGLVPNGPHHEIYLSDLRETPPADLRTILRQPVRAA
ncbi:MAG TPA: GyrI-like domain-containing protein [Thermomonospora sp.]|nr:GyrI-like domain-containing protein [Thermomonospora sp.]